MFSGCESPTSPAFLPRVQTLTLDFLYPHLPGNEGDHKVTGQPSKFPPELDKERPELERYGDVSGGASVTPRSSVEEGLLTCSLLSLWLHRP
jgi:hypothetical protein